MLIPITLLTLLGTLLFVGLGALLAWAAPLTLFQAICVIIGSALVMILTLIMTKISSLLPAYMHACNDDDDEWTDNTDEPDDEDGLADEQTDKNTPIFDVPPWKSSSPQVSRNAPCPCGSGQKFKKCCGSPPTR